MCRQCLKITFKYLKIFDGQYSEREIYVGVTHSLTHIQVRCKYKVLQISKCDYGKLDFHEFSFFKYSILIFYK